MSTIGDRLGAGARPQVGVGVSLAPTQLPKEQDVFNVEWKNGLDVADDAESIPTGAAASQIDTEADATDSLIRGAGVTLDQDVTPHSAAILIQQAAVDFSTELVIIDPPSLGYKSSGAFTFVNLGISPTSIFGWAFVDVAGQLIFSNGLDSTYVRNAGAAVITDISADIVAQCFATAFARVFAGSPIDPITGIQSLAIFWNAASGDVTDWVGLGSGGEFLITNNEQADRVVAIVPLGLQTMGILCRKSLWAGYQTGNSDRPADFQLRFAGLGCVRRETACSTPLGVVYLSDAGVCLFDLNSSMVISRAINGELIPLNYAQLDQYSAVYHETTQRYILTTPTGTFIYEFPHTGSELNVPGVNTPGRWFFRSFIPESITTFTNQSGNVYWNTVIGPWDLQTLTWAEMLIGEENAPSIVYFGKGTKVGYEDYGATDNLGAAQTPIWETPQPSQHVTDIFETHWFEVQYRAPAAATITFTTRDTNGDFTNSITKALPNTNNLVKRVMFGVSTMSGVGLALQISYSASSICAIERVRRVVMDAGITPDVTI